MLILLIFLLASYGVTNIVTGARIFKWLRELLRPACGTGTSEELDSDASQPGWLRRAFRHVVAGLGYWISCEMCFGFAVGVGWCALDLWPDLGLVWWKQWAAAGAVSSGWCWLVRVLLHKLDEDNI